MLSKELLEFLSCNQETNHCLINLENGIELIKNGLTSSKEILSLRLPELCIDNQYDKIKTYICLSQEIDAILSELDGYKIKILDTNNHNKKAEQGTDSSAIIEHQIRSVSLIRISRSNQCPICNNLLEDTQTIYSIFYDKNHQNFKKSGKTASKSCPECKKYFILSDLADSINLQIGLEYTNLVLSEIDNAPKRNCRWFGCDSTDIYLDGLCRFHFDEERHNSK